jgi:diguanylate cyclase (GGDEF)-like protein
VTVSIGVSSFPDDATADLELVRIADQRLYQAKHQGRNLVCAS